MTNRYALVDYTLTITLPSTTTYNTYGGGDTINLAAQIGLEASDSSFSIGGAGENGYEGSFLDEISVKRDSETWTTKADATGSWIHTKQLKRNGIVGLNIHQVSDIAVKLAVLCNAYENIQDAAGGLNLEVTNITGETVAKCIDCYIKKVPDYKFGEDSSTLDFEFTCGCIFFYPDGYNRG